MLRGAGPVISGYSNTHSKAVGRVATDGFSEDLFSVSVEIFYVDYSQICF
jgi:hypothetical protein